MSPGRLLMVAGMLILPLGLGAGLAQEGGRAIAMELGMMVAGALVFLVGWWMEKSRGGGKT